MVVNSSPQVFLFLSQILRKKIIDPMGRPQGRVSDLVVTLADLYPPVTGVLFWPWEKTLPVSPGGGLPRWGIDSWFSP